MNIVMFVTEHQMMFFYIVMFVNEHQVMFLNEYCDVRKETPDVRE